MTAEDLYWSFAREPYKQDAIKVYWQLLTAGEQTFRALQEACYPLDPPELEQLVDAETELEEALAVLLEGGLVTETIVGDEDTYAAWRYALTDAGCQVAADLTIQHIPGGHVVSVRSNEGDWLERIDMD
jgi:hypothetical protein